MSTKPTQTTTVTHFSSVQSQSSYNLATQDFCQFSATLSVVVSFSCSSPVINVRVGLDYITILKDFKRKEEIQGKISSLKTGIIGVQWTFFSFLSKIIGINHSSRGEEQEQHKNMNSSWKKFV